ncbi:MAG: hypothetical protein Q8K89_03780, partial [Actinomycetota bacterium]|nr:hypothetical protein [Actinomycetota bacterium]
CVACHTGVPHTSVRPRLTIGRTRDLTPYKRTQGGVDILSIAAPTKSNCNGTCGSHGATGTYW